MSEFLENATAIRMARGPFVGCLDLVPLLEVGLLAVVGEPWPENASGLDALLSGKSGCLICVFLIHADTILEEDHAD